MPEENIGTPLDTMLEKLDALNARLDAFAYWRRGRPHDTVSLTASRRF